VPAGAGVRGLDATPITEHLSGGFAHHGGAGDQNLLIDLPNCCDEVNRGAAALVLDLERRGLLDDDVVVFAPAPPCSRGRASRPRPVRGTRQPELRPPGSDRRISADLGSHRHDALGFGVVADPVHVHDLPTSRRRCCTCSASTTSGSSTASRGATSG